MRLALMLLLLTMAAMTDPTPASPATLVVLVRDVVGDPLPGIAVIVSNRSDSAVLARATTSSEGQASFDSLPTQEVRVAVSGSLPTGVPLRLEGADARGIAAILGAPPVRLELRVEPDGQVRPDPATMIAPDVGVPVATVPPLPQGSTIVPTVAPPSPSIEESAAAPAGDQAPALDGPLFAIGLVLVLCLGTAAALLLALHLRWRRL
jgi:hypothetical protein